MTYDGPAPTPPGANTDAIVTDPVPAGTLHGATKPVPGSAIVDGVDVDVVAAAVRACPGVSELSSGRLGDVASYLPGRRVPGVVVESDSVTVQVRSRWGVPAAELFVQISTALAVLRDGRRLHVVVADLDDPPDDPALPVGPAVTAAPAFPAGAGSYPSNPSNVSI